jgi:hypothetical protein
MPYKKEVYEILYQRIDPWIMQAPDQSKDVLFQVMVKDLEDGYTLAFENHGMIFYVEPENIWLCRLHIFSDAKTPIKMLKGVVENTNQIFDNMKTVKKLYGITPLKSIVKVSEKVGWKHEGTLKDSFMQKDGTLKDQYVFGVTRNENEIWRNK